MEHVETLSDYRGSAVRGCHWSVAGASPSGPGWPAQARNVKLSETAFEKVPSWSRPCRAKAEEDRPFSVFSSWPLQPWGLAAQSEGGVTGCSAGGRPAAIIELKFQPHLWIWFFFFFLKTHCFEGKDMISSNAACCSGSTGPENHFPPRAGLVCVGAFLFWVVRGNFCFLHLRPTDRAARPWFIHFYPNASCFLWKCRLVSTVKATPCVRHFWLV